jgi:hypothetical protein
VQRSGYFTTKFQGKQHNAPVIGCSNISSITGRLGLMMGPTVIPVKERRHTQTIKHSANYIHLATSRSFN